MRGAGGAGRGGVGKTDKKEKAAAKTGGTALTGGQLRSGSQAPERSPARRRFRKCRKRERTLRLSVARGSVGEAQQAEGSGRTTPAQDIGATPGGRQWGRDRRRRDERGGSRPRRGGPQALGSAVDGEGERQDGRGLAALRAQTSAQVADFSRKVQAELKKTFGADG